MWLEKAQGLRYCSEILNAHLVEDLINTPPASRRIETNGVVSSALLLLGLAFENLIKGVDVARDPTLVNLDRLDLRLWRHEDGGHGIRNFAKSLVTLDTDEEELLDRLLRIYFLGRSFPIPLKSGRYYESNNPVNKHRLSTADSVVAARLFEKLEAELRKLRSVHTR